MRERPHDRRAFERLVTRLDRLAGELNPCLLAAAIGLALLYCSSLMTLKDPGIMAVAQAGQVVAVK